jgi:glycosyltransferase involved in cell wall biosynthesis
MRVLHLIDSLAVGGAETLVVDSLNQFLVSHPEDQHYLVTLFDGGPLVTSLRNREGRYLNLGFDLWRAVDVRRRLRSFVRDNGIELVHSHLYKSTVFARLALPRRMQLVSTYHTGFHNPSSIEFSRKNLLLDRLTYRKAHHLIFVSRAVASEIGMGLPLNGNTTVLKNFIGSAFHRTYRYNQAPSLKLVAVGNLREQKNHNLALEALAKLRDYPISLDIYGRGQLQAVLQERIDRDRCRARLITDVRVTSQILDQYDAFLMTSRHEGMPLALLEAMRTGLPCILNDIPSLRETGEDAALYFTRDSAGSLASLLEQCLTNKRQLEPLADRAGKLSLDYTVERYNSSLRSIYQRLLAPN